MIKNINKDITFLSQKAEKATKDDLFIVEHLIDTLKANQATCVGMAANMIGYNKAIICISVGMFCIPMINPIIKVKKRPYQTKESCLSLIGERPCTRHEEIEVEYLDTNFNKQIRKYTGFTAEIIEHEVDHLNGIII